MRTGGWGIRLGKREGAKGGTVLANTGRAGHCSLVPSKDGDRLVPCKMAAMLPACGPDSSVKVASCGLNTGSLGDLWGQALTERSGVIQKGDTEAEARRTRDSRRKGSTKSC